MNFDLRLSRFAETSEDSRRASSRRLGMKTQPSFASPFIAFGELLPKHTELRPPSCATVELLIPMVQYIITPWRNHAELLEVRQQLYPRIEELPKDAERRHAVAKVSVWMQRGNCPHLVESTAILTSALLNDIPGNSAYCVRAAYSAAFCRFVTGLVDSHQEKYRKFSMYSIAKTIGLPATYVELRHQATHEELPSLSKLRIATQKALRWIWDYYWANLSSELPQGDEDDCMVFVRKLVQEADNRARSEMQKSLVNWKEDDLLVVLSKVHETANDPGTMLRAMELHNIIMNTDGQGRNDNSEPVETINDLNTLKNELQEMEIMLSNENEAPTAKRKASHIRTSSEGSGWSLWQGTWEPKPIGVV